MIINENAPNSLIRISRCDQSGVWANNHCYTNNILITKSLVTDWNIDDLSNINESHLTPILSAKPDIVLIGTGNSFIRAPKIIETTLCNHNIGLEIMNTASACRSFMLLADDSRHVLAALIIGT